MQGMRRREESKEKKEVLVLEFKWVSWRSEERENAGSVRR